MRCCSIYEASSLSVRSHRPGAVAWVGLYAEPRERRVVRLSAHLISDNIFELEMIINE